MSQLSSFDEMDLKNGGRPYGGLGKKTALQEWGASKGIKVMDLAEREVAHVSRDRMTG
jgi:hypothetical protein